MRLAGSLSLRVPGRMIALDLLENRRGAVEQRLRLQRGEALAGDQPLDRPDEADELGACGDELAGDVLVPNFARRSDSVAS